MEKERKTLNLKLSQEDYLLGLLEIVNTYLEEVICYNLSEGEGDNLPYGLEKEALWLALDELTESVSWLTVAKVVRKVKARYRAEVREQTENGLLWEKDRELSGG